MTEFLGIKYVILLEYEGCSENSHSYSSKISVADVIEATRNVLYPQSPAEQQASWQPASQNTCMASWQHPPPQPQQTTCTGCMQLSQRVQSLEENVGWLWNQIHQLQVISYVPTDYQVSLSFFTLICVFLGMLNAKHLINTMLTECSVSKFLARKKYKTEMKTLGFLFWIEQCKSF